MSNDLELPRRAHYASLSLARSKAKEREVAIMAIAEAIKRQQNDILEANTLDLEDSRDHDFLPEVMVDWLKLTPERLQATIQILERLAELSDPMGRMVGVAYQLDYAYAYSQRIPLGVIALIYEAFPELAIIGAGMCLKTANAIILQASNGVLNTHQVIGEIVQSALENTDISKDCILFSQENGPDALEDLVIQDQYINLVIPYGRPILVQRAIKTATAPILRTAIGNCYLYWSASASLDMARWMILDSHESKPDPVNSLEKVLLDPNQKFSSVVRLWNVLQEKGFEIRGDANLLKEFPDLVLVNDGEWGQPYLNKTIAFKVVESLDDAIAWINHYSSGHADCLATESYQESRKFALEVNSAASFINESPRFHRYPKRGDAVFLGMSNQKGYRRGLISFESLTTIKYIVQGNS